MEVERVRGVADADDALAAADTDDTVHVDVRTPVNLCFGARRV